MKALPGSFLIGVSIGLLAVPLASLLAFLPILKGYPLCLGPVLPGVMVVLLGVLLNWHLHRQWDLAWHLVNAAVALGLCLSLLPGFHVDYTDRALVSTVVNRADAMKVVIYDHHHSHGELPDCASPTVVFVLKELEAVGSGDYVKSATCHGATTDTLTLSVVLSPSVFGCFAEAGVSDTLRFLFQVNDGGLAMDCVGGTLEGKYRPGQCR